MPLFAVTIFCGAFLLFLVQPLMGKYILPWFGGGPGVWTTCLLFFQAMLLAGYAYAHGLSERLTPRRQILVHVGLLALALLLLPITPAASWKPVSNETPVRDILILLTATLGLPYLVLSATGPLLQRWFSLVHPGVPPYRLYALSNAGSLLALLAYPFFLEPRFSRTAIGLGWSAGLVVFVGLCGACAWRVRRLEVRTPPPSPVQPKSMPAERPPSALDRLLWVALPATASLLLVATTNKLCLDIAAVPFLWVLPLGVYLVTFILCFDHPRWYSRSWYGGLLGLSCGLLGYFLSLSAPPTYQQVIALTGFLFVACMVCHGELYRLRPSAPRLTGFYLAIAAGGAVGSLFVALFAPLLFSDYRELQLGVVLLLYFVGVICFFQRSRALVLGLATGLVSLIVVLPALRADRADTTWSWVQSFGAEFADFARNQWPALLASAVVLVYALRNGRRLARFWTSRMIAIPALLTLLTAVIFVRQAREDGATVYESSRNFYGAYKIHLYNEALEKYSHFMILSNGGITHGLQFLGGQQAGWATSYYSESSGLGRAFAALPPTPRRVAAVGLGTGTLAAYGRRGDTFRFYEINPAIIGVAEDTFSYLKNTPATVEIVPGDARLTLERELATAPSPQFDLLVLDAFAGDAIPVHLLTQEAMDLYLRALRPGGIIAVHISNRHLDLRAVVEGLAAHHGLQQATISNTVKPEDWWLYNTVWMLVSADPAVLARPEIKHVAQEPPDASARTVSWTDDHASLFEVMH